MEEESRRQICLGYHSKIGTGYNVRDRVPRKKQMAPVFSINKTSHVNWQVKESPYYSKNINKIDENAEVLL
jgi:hypothetical protein